MVTATRRPAGEVVAEVVDPEMPMLTLQDLGVVRSVRHDGSADEVTVVLTPTYSGCPALEEMRSDVRAALRNAGYRRVDVRTQFSPAWSTDWISEHGRRALAESGIAPPTRVGPRQAGPIPLTLGVPRGNVRCPNCGAPGTDELSRFGPTPCTELRRCPSCREPFEHMKEL
jgi:ring-1,2-phenylacetyl-CoA epoxidase subunit PaaD